MSVWRRLTILGCGSSGGVPAIDGDWGACDPTDPRNRRTRCSLLVEQSADETFPADATTVVLVDTSPDLRAQLLASQTRRVDAVLYTHPHADQCHGIDDLRKLVLRQGKPIPVHMDGPTAGDLVPRFRYIFEGAKGGLYPPILDLQPEMTPGRAVVLQGPGGAIEARPIAQTHGPIPSLGFRFGPAAYANDVSDLDETAFEALRGVRTWIVDALRYRPHKTHAHVDKALGWIARVGPVEAVLTNLHVDLDYAELSERLPSHVRPAVDGLRLTHRLESALRAADASVS